PHPPHPARARAGGEGLGDVGGIALAVGGNPHRADEVVGAEERITPPRLVEADLVRLDAEAARHGGVAPELGHALFRARDGQAAAAAEAGGLARLPLQPLVELRALAEEPRSDEDTSVLKSTQ